MPTPARSNPNLVDVMLRLSRGDAIDLEAREEGVDVATLVGRHWLEEQPVKAKAWLKSVSLKIEQGHAIRSDTLQRMHAVVAPARRRIPPEEGHRLHLVVEMCNAKRPTATLAGSHERYQETSARLMEVFQARVGPEWTGTSDYQLNPPPASLPHHFLSAKEGLRHLGTGDPLRGGAAFSEATLADVRKGRQAVTHTVPPRLQLYPRLGAFEVTALLFHGDTLVRPRPPPAPAPAPTRTPPPPPPRRASRAAVVTAHSPCPFPLGTKSPHGPRQVESECLFSKLLSRRWPADEHLMARLDGFVQQALWRDRLEMQRELSELVFEGHALYDAQLQRLRAAVAADGDAEEPEGPG